MRLKIFFLFFAVLLLSLPAFAGSNIQFARDAVSADPAIAEAAISSLRNAGQNGLDELFEVYGKEIEGYSKTGSAGNVWNRIAYALDNVAMQKDAYASKLFWFTDIDQALAASKRTGKPVLSLRLLGNLNEELSCANSRFFRAILYSNAEIAKTLRENYILHWKSVRPAPRITIDFGDGRKIERTITGNSIHYILGENGETLEALPGLYSPQEFSRYLKITSNLYRTVKSEPAYLESFHEMRSDQLLNKWEADLKRIGISIPAIEKTEPIAEPTALRAAPVAVTKMAVELKTVSLLDFSEESILAEKTDSEAWKKLGESYGKAVIAPESVAFIRRQTAANKDLDDKTFAKMISNLESFVAIDTVRNEYLYHSKIYEWLAEGRFENVEELNEAVYSQLFLTPNSDQWLGLYSADIYSALDGNGLIR